MNFFEHQQQAQQKTTRLVVLYFLGVLCTFAAVHSLCAVIAMFVNNAVENSGSSSDVQVYSLDSYETSWLNPNVLLIDFCLVTLIVGGGTLYRISEMKRLDGDGVAQSFGGIRVEAGKASPKERRLLNIVEEMAIASGVSVPNVYVLRNEPGINAFAAGFSQATSVVAVTQGALDYLNRDELQGVIAHEFSHILHQDTRLDMKLIGVLFGLELIALLGLIMIRCTPNVLIVDNRNDNEGGGNAALAIMLAILFLGFGLFLIGLIGQLFANIIRAAVSRQREFLADASAVQYTRNPAGISGALQKIGSMVGSKLNNRQALGASHIFFGNALGSGFFSHIFDSHPDLTTRIQRIDPSFNGKCEEKIARISDNIDPEEGASKKSGAASIADSFRFGRESLQGGSASKAVSMTVAAAILDGAGQITEKKLRVAESLLEKIPGGVNDAVTSSSGAAGTILAVILDKEPELRKRELEFLHRSIPAEVMQKLSEIEPLVMNISDSVKIPIVQKAFPALKSLHREEYIALRKIIADLMKFDGQIDILEFTIAGLIINELDLYFRTGDPISEKYSQPRQIESAFQTAASFIAYAGSEIDEECVKAFSEAVREIGLQASILSRESCRLPDFYTAVRTLACASISLREKILKALYACIIADGVINEKEGELLRAVTAFFHVPMPTWE